MSERQDNLQGGQGIRIHEISGGQSTFGIASGAGSHVGSTINYGSSASQQEELRALVTDLLAIVARHQNQLADPQGAGTAVELLREEAAGEQRRNRLTGFLSMLTASAGGVAAITEAAAKVKELIASML